MTGYGKEKMNKAAKIIGNVGINDREWKAHRLEAKNAEIGLVILNVNMAHPGRNSEPLEIEGQSLGIKLRFPITWK